MITQNQIESLCNNITMEYAPYKIYIFGSCTKGEQRETSDLDLLVIVNEGDTNRIRKEIIENNNPSFAIDLIIKKKEDFIYRLAENDFFLADIVKNGKLVYEKHELEDTNENKLLF
jgi:predicted nucleotidyltransferase